MQVEQGQLRRFTVSDVYSTASGAGDSMKRGDLCKFKDALDELDGRSFMVLEVRAAKLDERVDGDLRVDFLIDGRIETGWGYPWLQKHSEVLNAAG